MTGQIWFANWLICTSPVYKISDLGCRDRRPADRIKEINPAPFPTATVVRTLGPHGSIEDQATGRSKWLPLPPWTAEQPSHSSGYLSHPLPVAAALVNSGEDNAVRENGLHLPDAALIEKHCLGCRLAHETRDSQQDRSNGA